MISRDFRPRTFEEVAGNKLNISILKKIIENPESSPRCLLFQGSFGCGKTTLARIFARALNCQGDNKPCGECSNCKKNLDESYFYSEYDSSVVGNVEEIRKLRDSFGYVTTGGYRVIVLDEVHLISRVAQSALLKVFEDNKSNVFFVLATTNPEKVLQTIKSRSLILDFKTIEHKDVVDNLREVSGKLNISPSDTVLDIIARRSRGHMRNAHMLLDMYNLLGEEKFKENVKDCTESILDFFQALATREIRKLYESIDIMVSFPLDELIIDFQEVVLNLMKTLVSKKGEGRYIQILSRMGKNAMKIIKLCISPIIIDSFSSDYTLQTALLAIYQMTETSDIASQSSLKERAVRRT